MGDDVIDVVRADELGPGDHFRYDGVAYLAISIEDDGEFVMVATEPLDNTDGDEYVLLDPYETVEIVGFVA